MPTVAEIEALIAEIHALIGLSAAFPQSRWQLTPTQDYENRYRELWGHIEEGLAALRQAGFPLSHPNAHHSLRAMWAWCWNTDAPGGRAAARMARPQELYEDLLRQLADLRGILTNGADAPEEVFREFREAARRTNELFTIMALRAETTPFWEQVVRPAAEAVGLRAVRIDAEEPEAAISEAILSSIRRATLVLCDLSFERPNCYFEAGFAKGSFRRVIFTARADHDPRAAVRGEYRVHFDTDQLKTTFWNPDDLPRARAEIEERLANLLRDIQQPA
jgi:hypothetical protein